MIFRNLNTGPCYSDLCSRIFLTACPLTFYSAVYNVAFHLLLLMLPFPLYRSRYRNHSLKSILSRSEKGHYLFKIRICQPSEHYFCSFTFLFVCVIFQIRCSCQIKAVLSRCAFITLVFNKWNNLEKTNRTNFLRFRDNNALLSMVHLRSFLNSVLIHVHVS